MKRAALLILPLLMACKTTPSNLLAPKGDTADSYIETMKPGDSRPFRLQGGAYFLSVYPLVPCEGAVKAQLKRYGETEVISEDSGTVLNRRIEGLKPGIYVLNVVPQQEGCESEFTLAPD